MVLYTKMESLATTMQGSKQMATEPIGIPTNPWNELLSKQTINNLEEDWEEEQTDAHEAAEPQAEEPHHNIVEEELIEVSEGSPSFITVMNELHISLKNLPHHDDHKTPISPLALNKHKEVFHHETSSPESKSPVQMGSPESRKKRVFSASTSQQSRSQSWNHRNKMAAERRRQMALAVPHSYETSSTHSSPMMMRKASRSKSQPTTPKIVRLIPKYKFLTETVSVSHEDLVMEQEKERLLAEGFAEAKSIFHSPVLYRFGDTPE